MAHKFTQEEILEAIKFWTAKKEELNEAKDLTKFKGTIGSVFMANRDKLLAVKSSKEAYDLVSQLFSENGIDTPKSRQILLKLQHGMSYIQTVTYLNNIILKSQGLGINDSENSHSETKKMREISESEDLVTTSEGVTVCGCRDLIWDNAPKDSSLQVHEIFISNTKFLKDRIGININQDDIDKLRKMISGKDLDHYRFMVYSVKAARISDFSNAQYEIEDEADFSNYIDPESRIWRGYEDEFDTEFAEKFKTYEEWLKFLSDANVKELKQILDDTNEMTYTTAAEDIKIASDGTAYTIIAWRA